MEISGEGGASPKQSQKVYRAVFRCLRIDGLSGHEFQWQDCSLRFSRGPILSMVPKFPEMRLHSSGDFYTLPPDQSGLKLEVESQTLPGEDYLEIIAPCNSQDFPEVLAEGRQKIEPLLSIIRLLLGERPLDERMLEDVLEIDEKPKYTVATPSVRIERNFPIERYDTTRINELKDALRGSENLAAPERDPLLLALRWYWKAVQERQDVDKYIALWIALEILVTKEKAKNVVNLTRDFLQRNILPQFDKGVVKQRLEIGELYDLRRDIVHYGLNKLPEEKADYLDRLQEIVEEIIRCNLGLASKGSLLKYFSNSDSVKEREN